MAVVHVLPGVSQPSATLEPDPEVLKLCEDILTLAREGKIRELAYAFVDNRGCTAQGWTIEDSTHRLTASVAYLQHRMCALQVDDSDPTDMPSNRPEG